METRKQEAGSRKQEAHGEKDVDVRYLYLVESVVGQHRLRHGFTHDLVDLDNLTYLSRTRSTRRHKLTGGEALGDTGGSTSHCHTVWVSVKVALALVSGRHSGGPYTFDSRNRLCGVSSALRSEPPSHRQCVP